MASFHGSKAIELSQGSTSTRHKESVLSGLSIQTVLRAPVDLWNGGIGTYVKASTETQVGPVTCQTFGTIDATEVGPKLLVKAVTWE